MDARQLIDAQFNRAVEIVQGLPKTGPIQTGYEEKLTMYSLYKQATVGNVMTSRPGIFDMLGRAKWDAWAKHRDLDQYEARSLYVDALLKALNKHSDRTVARDFIDELRSYGGVSESLVSSYTLARKGSRGSSSSSSTVSEDDSARPPSHGRQDFQHPSARQDFSTILYDETPDNGEAAEGSRDHLAVHDIPQQQRPLSSVSFSPRYKTPLTGSYAIPSSPPRRVGLPPVQPAPSFETPSAFADPSMATSTIAPSLYNSSAAYVIPPTSRISSPQIPSGGAPYRDPINSRPSAATAVHSRPPSRVAPASLEHAMESVQAHIAALTERIDTLELALATRFQPLALPSPSHASPSCSSPTGSRPAFQPPEWNIDDMGFWTLVLKPLFCNLSFIQRLLVFFLKSGRDRSPLLVVVRRLCLDISFLMVVIKLLRIVWVKSGTRRREVSAALVLLWGAVVGRKRIHVRRI